MSLLTSLERKVIQHLGLIWNDLCEVVDTGPSRENDLAELVVHVHALQQAVMSNAAGRAYPNEYRLLGSMLRPDVPREPRTPNPGVPREPRTPNPGVPERTPRGERRPPPSPPAPPPDRPDSGAVFW